jgi:hypothetical protein
LIYDENTINEEIAGDVILIHEGNTLTEYDKCGGLPWYVFTVSGNNVTSNAMTEILSGTIQNDKTIISGTGSWGGTFKYEKVSNETDFIYSSNSSLTIQGDLCGSNIDVNSDRICAVKDFYDGSFDDIQIDTEYQGRSIGIEIEEPHLLASNTTYDIQTDGFIVDIQGSFIYYECSGEDEVSASSGTVIIDIYDGTRLKGSFDIVLPGGDNLTGSFDVNLDDKG